MFYFFYCYPTLLFSENSNSKRSGGKKHVLKNHTSNDERCREWGVGIRHLGIMMGAQKKSPPIFS